MSDYGNDFVVLTDDEGNEYEFEHLDTLEQNGETYMAFIPAEMSLEDEAELVVLKLINEGRTMKCLPPSMTRKSSRLYLVCSSSVYRTMSFTKRTIPTSWRSSTGMARPRKITNKSP